MDKPVETEATATETDAPAPKPEPTAASGTDPDSLRRALAKQAEEFRTNEAKLQKQLAAHESEKLKAKEAKLITDNELQKLIDLRDATIKEMTDKSTAANRALLESAAREKLRDLGMTRALSLAGAVAGLPADATAETLEAWVAQVHLANAPEFTAPATPIKSGDAGDPSINAGAADLESRLKSDDPKIRAAAFSEQLKQDLTGTS